MRTAVAPGDDVVTGAVGGVGAAQLASTVVTGLGSPNQGSPARREC